MSDDWETRVIEPWETRLADWLTAAGLRVGPRVTLQCRYGHELLPVRVQSASDRRNVEIVLPVGWRAGKDGAVEDRYSPEDHRAQVAPEVWTDSVPAGGVVFALTTTVRLRCQQPSCRDTPEMSRRGVIEAYMTAVCQRRKKLRLTP